MRPRLYSDGIVSVVNHAVKDLYIRRRNVEPIGVEGEATGNRVRVNDRVCHRDVASEQLDVPANGFA